MTYPPAGATANEGMVPMASRRRRTIIAGAEIGRVSQATKSLRLCATREVDDPRGLLLPLGFTLLVSMQTTYPCK